VHVTEHPENVALDEPNDVSADDRTRGDVPACLVRLRGPIGFSVPRAPAAAGGVNPQPRDPTPRSSHRGRWPCRISAPERVRQHRRAGDRATGAVANCIQPSLHLVEFPDGQAQTDQHQPENDRAQEKKIDANHCFLPSNAATLK
jgi:hypothetical protein